MIRAWAKTEIGSYHRSTLIYCIIRYSGVAAYGAPLVYLTFMGVTIMGEDSSVVERVCAPKHFRTAKSVEPTER